MLAIKFYKYFLYFVLIVTVAGTIFVVNRNRISGNCDTREEVPSQKNLAYQLQISGFKFDSFEDTEHVLSIKAEKFTIEKKKLGFFRLGLIHDAIFENAIIDVYLKTKTLHDDTNVKGAVLPYLKDALPSFDTKRISSILIEPVCLNLLDGKSLLTRITSNAAIISLIKQNICFKGNVRVVSADKSLITEHLNFFPENSVMETDRHYILKNPEKTIEGKNITLDVFLNVVEDKIIKRPDRLDSSS